MNTRLSVIGLAILTLTGSLVSSMAAPNTYRGKVGRLDAVFLIQWGDDNRISGSYSYPSRKGVVYTLRGNNFKEGELYLEEFTGRELSAKCYLKKRLNDQKIVWSGEMHNTDGRVFELFFSRDREKTPAAIAWNSAYDQTKKTIGGSHYLGRIGEEDYDARLTWGNDGDLTAIFKNKAGRILHFKGYNATDGHITLRLLEDGLPTKNVALVKKRFENGTVIWEGIFLAEGDKRIPIIFGRGLQKKLAVLPVARMENLLKIKAVTNWAEPSHRKTPVESTPWRNDRIFNARVTSTSYDGQNLSVTFKLDGRAKGALAVIEPTVRNVTLNVDYPDGRNPFKKGMICDVQFDDQGICEVPLAAIAVTHWRKIANGMVEIRGVEYAPIFNRDTERFPPTDTEIRGLRTLTMLPDKLAMNKAGDDQTYWRGAVFMRNQGLVVKTWTAGGGELSLSRISLDEDEEILWISVRDRSGRSSIPLTQKTSDAG